MGLHRLHIGRWVITYKPSKDIKTGEPRQESANIKTKLTANRKVDSAQLLARRVLVGRQPSDLLLQPLDLLLIGGVLSVVALLKLLEAFSHTHRRLLHVALAAYL